MLKKTMSITAICLATCLITFLSCDKKNNSLSNEKAKVETYNESENQFASKKNSDCMDLEQPNPIPNEVKIISIKGNLRRPKVLNCSAVQGPKACYCGFGVCDVSVEVLGHTIIGDNRLMPNTPQNPSNNPNIDRAMMIASVDGKYAFIKFTKLTENDRQVEKLTFIIDEEVTLSSPGNSQKFCQTIDAQNAITIYPDNYSNIQNIINNLSLESNNGTPNEYYFYFNANELNITNTDAVAIIRLH